MKFTLDSRDDINLIRGYTQGEVRIGEQVAHAPCIVTAQRLILDWSARDVATLSVAQLAPIFELQPDVVLLGTGTKQTFPAGAVRQAFAARGFSLHRLPGAELLAAGPEFVSLPRTTDPARLLGGGIGGSTVDGPGAAQLLMLGAELEMWLHAHPLNAARARRREAPLTTLWLWGGGKPLSAQLTAPLLPTAHPDSTFMTVFGEDPVAAGLCTLSGAHLRPPAASAHDILNSGAARTAAVIELFRKDKPQPATLLDLLQHLDEMVLAPVITALKDGAIRQLTLVANDRCSILTARDGLRFWRRSRGPWAVLQ